MWEPYYTNAGESRQLPYGTKPRGANEDTWLEAMGGGTADPDQAVRLRSGGVDAHGVQLTDLVQGESSGQLVSYVRSRDLERLAPRDRVRRRLARAGLLANVEPALLARYASESGERISPLAMEGKPLSQVVIEERE